MGKLEITEEKFKRIVDVKKISESCKGAEQWNAPARQGHEKCKESCIGNYFVNGECNYGGEHTMEKDLARINTNFSTFGLLEKKYSKLQEAKSEAEFDKKKEELLTAFNKMKDNCENPNNFLFGSCIGIHDSEFRFREEVKEMFAEFSAEIISFIRKLSKATYKEFADYLVQLEKMEQISKEQASLATKLRDPKTSKAEKNRIETIILANDEQLLVLNKKLTEHTAKDLFDDGFRKRISNFAEEVFNFEEENKEIKIIEKKKKVKTSPKNKPQGKQPNKEKLTEEKSEELISPTLKKWAYYSGITLLYINDKLNNNH